MAPAPTSPARSGRFALPPLQISGSDAGIRHPQWPEAAQWQTLSKHAHSAHPAPNTGESSALLHKAPMRPGRAQPTWDVGGSACPPPPNAPSHLCKHSAADRTVVLVCSLWNDCIWKCYGCSQSHSSDCSGHREEKAHCTGMPTICC